MSIHTLEPVTAPPIVLYHRWGEIIVTPRSRFSIIVSGGRAKMYREREVIAVSEDDDFCVMLATVIARGIASGDLNPNCRAQRFGVRKGDLVGCFAVNDRGDAGNPIVAVNCRDLYAVANLSGGHTWIEGRTPEIAMVNAAALFLAAA